MARAFYLICLILLTMPAPAQPEIHEYATQHLVLSVNETGCIGHFTDRHTGADYLYPDSPATLLTIRSGGAMLLPFKATFRENGQRILLWFDGNIQAEIMARVASSHVTFELVSVTPPGACELIVWGPFPTILNERIGETVGVVTGHGFSIGIQSLNPKTLGGYPWQENDCMPQIDIFDQADPTDLSEEGKRYVLYRVEAAKPAGFGSTLQAYCRNRDRERIVANWGFERYTVPVFPDGGVTGSKIALFGCPVNETLETIGTIELAEGLPHPLIDGRWGKTAPEASSAYLIMGFSEANLDSAMDITRKAGLRHLYHPDPFETWGHFTLRPEFFPDGVKSLKRCVERAAGQGITLGVHTLSNFITTTDAYVTPVPDHRLARVGSTTLASDVDSLQTEFKVSSTGFFLPSSNDNLRCILAGNEIIQYSVVHEGSPGVLSDCRRGAFGTKKENHRIGDTIHKLADHAYRVFLTNPGLTSEVAENLANLFNETGIRQISFDGLEGNRSTGMGNYGEILFTTTWYDNLSPFIRENFIADASRTSHYFWHIYSRMNWGEPWYAGFRESQTEYRLRNQAYFRRNLMPGMLGWFNMTPYTSMEDIEWMLARSAAFDAGYAFCTGFAVLRENGVADSILSLLGEWEKARMVRAFSPGQKNRMERVSAEFHLQPTGFSTWNLIQVFPVRILLQSGSRQPGEPPGSHFTVENPVAVQPAPFIITSQEGTFSDIRMGFDRLRELSLPVTLRKGEHLKYSGGDRVIHYTPNWTEADTVAVDPATLLLENGSHVLWVEADAEGGNGSLLIEFRFAGQAEVVPSVDTD